VREDKSGTTEIWKKALAAFDPAFASEIGVSSKPTWNLPINATPHYKRDTNAGVGAFVSAQALGLGRGHWRGGEGLG
jgi:hypothetical protein